MQEQKDGYPVDQDNVDVWVVVISISSMIGLAMGLLYWAAGG